MAGRAGGSVDGADFVAPSAEASSFEAGGADAAEEEGEVLVVGDVDKPPVACYTLLAREDDDRDANLTCR